MDEIRQLATLLCLPQIDPAEIVGALQESLEKLGMDSPSTTKSGSVVSYTRAMLPGEITERIEQSFGAWMALHGYPVKLSGGQEGLSGLTELLLGKVLRVQNCPRRPV